MARLENKNFQKVMPEWNQLIQKSYFPNEQKSLLEKLILAVMYLLYQANIICIPILFVPYR